MKKSLHVNFDRKPGSWAECDESVASALDGDKSKPAYVHLPRILKEIPVLLFSGDKDLICNHIGTEMMIDVLEWGGAKGFQNSSGTEAWLIDGQPTGTLHTERNLTYALIYNASHMVAVDNPNAMLVLLNNFIGISESAAASPANNSSAGQIVVVPQPQAPKTSRRYYIAWVLGNETTPTF